MQRIVIILIALTISLTGQEITNWQNFSNMEDVEDISINESRIWAATNGGIFSYSLIDSSYKTLTKSEGLSSQSITAIAVDKNKNIWLGSIDGYINVYYPETGQIKTILEINKTNNSQKGINNITISGDTAFVSTDFGLSLININNLSFFDSILKFGSFPSKTPVKSIYLGSTIFVVTNAGIAAKKNNAQNLTAPETWEVVNVGSQTPVNSINKIVEYKNSLYAATDYGLVKITNNTGSIILYNNFKVHDFIINNNYLFSVLDNTIHKYDGTSDIVELMLSSIRFNTLKFISDDTFVIASSKGVIINDGSETHKIFPNGPKTNAALSLTVDSDGHLWSATGKDGRGIGVLEYDKTNWLTHNTSNVPEFKSNDFHRVSSSNNSVFFNNWGRGFVQYSNGEYKSFDAETTDIVGIPEDNSFIVINDVQEDSKENIWVLNFWAANKKPLSVLTPEGNWYHYQFANSISPTVVQAENMVIDQFSTKWFGVTGLGAEGLYYFNENGTLNNLSDDTWGRITKYSGLRDNIVKALAIDRFGELIIGTSVGVDVIIDPSEPNSIDNNQYRALTEQTINCIAVDPINQKWFGTTKGVFFTSPDGSRLLASYNTSNSPIPSDDIKSIAIDENSGIVYVGTNLGVTAITTMFIKPKSDLSELFVYPNPVTIDNNTNLNIIIDGLIENSQIKILDISGKLIYEFSSIGGRTTFWDLRDFNGEYISSGIYIAVVFDNEANQVAHTKFAVIRK
jgi:ligand-binding sensor domain-containing protein